MRWIEEWGTGFWKIVRTPSSLDKQLAPTGLSAIEMRGSGAITNTDRTFWQEAILLSNPRASESVGLLKLNAARGKAARVAKGASNDKEPSGMRAALDGCWRPDLRTNCQRRPSGLQSVVRHSVAFGIPATLMTLVVSY